TSQKRKSIQMNEHERKTLIRLYQRGRIPIDQYEGRPDELEDLCEEWRRLCGRTDSNGEILHYMRTQRKRGLWVVFGGDHEDVPTAPKFSAEDVEQLITIYGEQVAVTGDGSDNIAYDGEVAQRIAKRFTEVTGRIVPAHML